LFIRVSYARVRDGHVRPDAIRIEDCAVSVNREKYSDSPADVLLAAAPEHNGIAFIVAGDVPTAFRPPADHLVSRVVDDPICNSAPLPDNKAHAEIRFVERGKPYDKQMPLRAAVKSRLKDAIADRLNIYLYPTKYGPVNES
jgi:hypothetical protein